MSLDQLLFFLLNEPSFARHETRLLDHMYSSPTILMQQTALDIWLSSCLSALGHYG